MARKLYGDLMSQPVRAIIIFCRMTGIEFEFVQTLLHKKQQRSKDFRTNIYPLGKLPVFQEDDLIIPESAAILAYLASTNNVADHWYPADPKGRAKVDAAMHWHHANIRQSATLLLHRVVGKVLGIKPEPVMAAKAEELLLLALKGLETYWLAATNFVAGEEISVADLLMVTELDMLHLLAGATEGKTREEIFAAFPKVREWMQRVSELAQPHHKEVSQVLMQSAAKYAALKAKQQAKL